MPLNKNATLRFRIIDDCLTNTMHPYPTLKQIIDKVCELCGPVSESSISKDFGQMRRIYQAPIQFSNFNKGYYYTEPGFSIKQFPLTEDEVQALDFSTALLSTIKNTTLLQHFENAINKVIEGYRISKIIGKSVTNIIQTEHSTSTDGQQWLESLLRNITEGKKALTINYQPFGKEIQQHIFSPYFLKEYHNRWYIIGFSSPKNKVITLSLDRIEGLHQSDTEYFRDPQFNVEEYFQYSYGITQLQNEKPHKVLLSFTPETAPYILSQPLHQSQIIIQKTETEVIAELNVYITKELLMSILSFGAEVKVIAPDVLQKQLKNEITLLQKLYL